MKHRFRPDASDETKVARTGDLHGAAADSMSAGDRHNGSFCNLSLQPYAQGWMLSLLLHGTALGASLAMLDDLKLVPEPEPFKWEVSLVEMVQPQAEQPAMAEPAPPPIEPKPVPQKPPASETPVEPKIVEPIQQAEPVQQIEPMNKIEPPPQVVEEPPPPKLEQKVEETKPVEPIHEAVTEIPRATEPAMPPQPPAFAKTEAKIETKEVARADTAPPVQTAPPPVPTPPTESPVAKEPAPAPPQPIQEATLRPQPAAPAQGKKTDFGWLAQSLWDRVARLKRYPHAARLHHLEGRVVVRAVITEHGELADVEIAQSSGHQILDDDALEVIRRACPLKLRQPLGRHQVVVQVPINYRLEN